MAPKSKFVLPKSLAACADLLYETRAKRLEIQKQVDELSKNETTIKERLIAELPKGEATGIAGHVARVAVLMKLHVDVTDIEAAKAYAIKTKRWDLFQQLRVSEPAVRDMWENGKAVPGLAPIEYPFVSVTKV